MGLLVLTIVDPTRSETTVELPGDQPVGRILPKLVAILTLRQSSETRFILCQMKTGRDLDPSKTLEEQEVVSFDLLRLWTPDEKFPQERGPWSLNPSAPGKDIEGPGYPSKGEAASDLPSAAEFQPPRIQHLVQELWSEVRRASEEVLQGARAIPLLFLHCAFIWLWTGPLVYALQRDMHLPISAVSSIRLYSQLAGLILPLLAGQAADRWVRGNALLSVSYLLAGACLALAHWTATIGQGTPITLLSLIASGFFWGPTLGLVNALTLSTLPDPRMSFPILQAVGMLAVVMGIGKGKDWPHPLLLGSAVLGAAGLYSLTLPRMHPERTGTPRFAPAGALGIFKELSTAVLVTSVFLISALAVLDNVLWSMASRNAGLGRGTTTIPVGVISSVVALVVAAVFYRRLGAKGLLAIGMASMLLRSGLLVVMATPSLGSQIAMTIRTLAESLEGFRSTFLFTVALVFVECTTPPGIRSSVQCLLALLIMGIAPILGNLGLTIIDRMQGKDFTWQQVPVGQGIATTAILIVFLCLFRPRVEALEKEPSAE